MKSFRLLFIFLLCIVFCVLPVCAEESVVFVSGDGSGDGTSAETPLGSMDAAYATLENGGGTIVICGDYAVSATVNFPSHTETVKLTSVYGGVDYRTANDAALHNAGTGFIKFNGPTEIDGLCMKLDKSAAGIAANFHPLTIGYDFSVVRTDGSTDYALYLVGGQNGDSTIPALGEGETNEIRIYSGKFIMASGFSRSVALSHTGTVTMTFGGTADVRDLYLGALSTGAKGGTGILNLTENAKATTVFLSGNTVGMNGSAVVNLSGSASIGAFKNYSTSYFPNGTRTLRVTSADAVFPSNYAECFDAAEIETEPVSLDVVFVTDNGSGNGESKETPVGSLLAAYNALGPSGGTIVVCGPLTMEKTTAPAHSGKVTITSLYGGKDYRTDGAKLYYPGSSSLFLGGETLFENLSVELVTSGLIAAAFHPLTFGEGITVTYDTAEDANGLYLVGGDNLGSNTQEVYAQNPSITLKSGSFRTVVGFSRYCGSRIHTGHAEIDLSGDAYVRYLFAGAVGNGATANAATIRIADGVIVEDIYTGGSGKTDYMTGDVVIDLTAITTGTVYEFDGIGLYTKQGEVTLLYDLRTVPDGVLHLAELALFDNILSLCDIVGAHSFGAEIENPFDPNLPIHTCTICGCTEPTGDVPTAVADSVVFVADGGFGSGVHPSVPLGSYEAAFEALGDAGGTIVIIGKCTIPANMTYKHGSDPAFFQEPTHTGEILITSVYGGIDYRLSGAELLFDGNMDYRLSGPLKFEQLLFGVSGEPTENTIAARYFPLTFGKDCAMSYTYQKDGYRLNVAGGYKFFRYTDFVGVDIEDEWLRLCNHAVRIQVSELPDEAALTPNPSATLRTEAAAAFNRMFADMEALGLKVPTISIAMQSYAWKYDFFANFLGNTRAAHPDWSYERAYIYVTKSCGEPGGSEHHLGLAVDMFDNSLPYGSSNNHHYDETEEWAWILENGADYGIILRYPENEYVTRVTGFINEEWHFRYIGIENAKAMQSCRTGLLEDYVGEKIGLFAKDSSLSVESGSFYTVNGGSVGCDELTFTGDNSVTVSPEVSAEKIVGLRTSAGDMNGDGVLSLHDVLLALRGLLNGSPSAVADMNGDGKVSLVDILLILKEI